MENLTREYFKELAAKYPEAVEHFLYWLEQYKMSVGWDSLFGQDAYDGPIDFYDLPYDMQNGIMARFDIEKFMGKNGYMKIKRNESNRYDKLFADVQDAINDRSIKLN